jgi:hypothetical protein
MQLILTILDAGQQGLERRGRITVGRLNSRPPEGGVGQRFETVAVIAR